MLRFRNEVCDVIEDEEFYIVIPDLGRIANAHNAVDTYHDTLQGAVSTANSLLDSHNWHMEHPS